MNATSLEKQKKGNLYVYKLAGAGGRTPEYQPPATSAAKRIVIPSNVWGLRKLKSKSISKLISKLSNDEEKGITEIEEIKGEGRKSVSSVEGIIMKGSGSLGEGARKSVSHVENNMAYVGKFVENKPRKSGAKLETNVESAIALLQVKVLVTDMPGFMQIQAFQCARKTYDSLEKFSTKHLAYNLKKEFDKVYGPAWHCIVGSSFGSFVTHATGCFLYFSMEKLCILLFRTKVQRVLQQ